MQSRPRSNEVFAACVALQTSGELRADLPGHTVVVTQKRDTEGEDFVLTVDGSVTAEGPGFEVAAMFVTITRALRDRPRPSSPPDSHTRLRALASQATVPASIPALKKG